MYTGAVSLCSTAKETTDSARERLPSPDQVKAASGIAAAQAQQTAQKAVAWVQEKLPSDERVDDAAKRTLGLFPRYLVTGSRSEPPARQSSPTTPHRGRQEQAMKTAQMKDFLTSLNLLTTAQRAQALTALQAGGSEQTVCELIESRLAPSRTCPHCAGTQVVRNGSASGLQRYKCRACQRTFNALTATPLAHLRLKAKWLAQQDVLSQGLSVARAAQALAVAKTTAFRWRHRFLQIAKSVKAADLAGVVEADETYFLRSNKGQRTGRTARKRGGRASRKDRGMDLIPVLVARDRSGATADFLLEAVSKACLSEALKPRIHADAILCSDASAALGATAKALGLQHEALNLAAGERTRGPWHIQNVNAFHSRLKGWLARFKGVATDYLESYLGWFRALDRASRQRQPCAPMLALGLGMGDH